MSLAELIEERDRIISEIREIEEGMCDDDTIIFPDSQTLYHYNHLYLAEVCKRISEMSFQDDFEDVLKNAISDSIVDDNGGCI